MGRLPIVLNTRPAGEQAVELSALLREAGFEPLEVPATEVVPEWAADAIRSVARGLADGDYEWTVFPSANAARYLLEALATIHGQGASPGTTSAASRHGPDRRGGAGNEFGRGTRVLCGTGTASAVGGWGVQADVVLDRFSALAALERLLKEGARSVLVPRAREGRAELVEGLRAASVRVTDVVVYRAEPLISPRLAEAASLLRQRRVAGVALASPLAARSLVSGLARLGEDPAGLLRETALVCIGETTARAVAELSVGVPMVARGTSMKALVEALTAGLRQGTSPCTTEQQRLAAMYGVAGGQGLATGAGTAGAGS